MNHDQAAYADLRREYEKQHRALVEAQRAWIATGELRDKAEDEIKGLQAQVARLTARLQERRFTTLSTD